MLYSSVLFPAFFIIIFLVILIPIVIISVYLRIYTRHINHALSNRQFRTKMAPPHNVIIISTIVVLFLGIIVSLFVGYKTAQNYYEGSIEQFSATEIETYYAKVKEIGEKTITVEGISINEEKYRGEFQYEIWGEVSIVKGNELISLSDLEQGDLVSIIIVCGEGHLNGITDVFKITLINEAENINFSFSGGASK